MTTVVGEALAAGKILLQIVEVGQRCVAAVKRWQAFSKDAGTIYLKFSHENRKMVALQLVLMDKEKLGLGKPLFELMEPQQQHDIKDILLHLLQLLYGFESLVDKFNLSGTRAESSGTEELLESALASQALEDALPDLARRVRWLQTTTGWTKKVRWTTGGKTDAEKLVAGIRDWLTLIAEEIDQQFWSLAMSTQETPHQSRPEAETETETNANGANANAAVADEEERISASFKRLSLLGNDQDITTLSLNSSMRVRKFVLQLQTQRSLALEAFPDSLVVDTSSVQIGHEVQHARYAATLTKGTSSIAAFVEFRSYQGDSRQTESGMQSLCMMLTEPKDEGFRLPKPEGLFHDETKKRFGLVFPLASIGAQDLSSIWTLDNIISSADRTKMPLALKTPLLEDRFRLAFSVAAALARFHSVSWYYQGMQSKNICLLAHSSSKVSFDKPFLFGFTKTRAFGEKISYPDEDILSNVYRHPLRWEPQPKSRHNALHDLYSLGIVMLEIGMWRLIPSLLSPTGRTEDFDVSKWTSTKVQDHLKKWAQQPLASVMGTPYQQIVLALLDAKPESTSIGTWQTLPAQKRLMHSIGALHELCASLTLTLDIDSGAD
jgi:hypothetical protein